MPLAREERGTKAGGGGGKKIVCVWTQELPLRLFFVLLLDLCFRE